MTNILVVDDEPRMLQGLSRILVKEGYSVETAANGNEAVEEIYNKNFDIVVTDLKMPGINGMEILKKAKKRDTETRVVMITGFGSIQNAVEAMRRGASDYITKPFNPDKLRNCIKDVIKERKFISSKDKILESRHEKFSPEDLDKIIKSLSYLTRRRILNILSLGSSSFTNILNTLKIDDPTKLSFHLRVLKQSGLVNQDENKKYFLTSKGKNAFEVIEQLKEA